MQFMCLIYESESLWETRSEQEKTQIMQQYFTFTNEVKSTGKLVAGEPLQPTSTATSVRVRNGGTLVTDGPFAETKEQLGGFYLIECDSLEEALSWAAKIPAAADGTIEVRPLMQIEMPQQ